VRVAPARSFGTIDPEMSALSGSVAAKLAPLVLGLAAVGQRHHNHFASVDLLGLGLAAFASWVGIPGPGEPVLIAAGVLAAKHHLAIGAVLIAAFAGATLGGVLGWLAGVKLGRRALAGRGPLQRLRHRALDRGEDVFRRAPVLAVLLAPSWVAGIHRVRLVLYLPVNILGAAAWTGGIGLGAYLAGPPIVDLVGDTSSLMLIGLVALVVLVLGTETVRRRRAVPGD
jgi:membrane protein DedA with SNARE-associated domain